MSEIASQWRHLYVSGLVLTLGTRLDEGEIFVLCITVSRETNTIRCMYRERWIHFKKLTHAIVSTDKSKICRPSQQSEEV